MSDARITIALVLLGACATRTGEVGKGYTKVLETFAEDVGKLDVVFVVDDSGSMADDQRALVEGARSELFGQLEAQPGGMPDLHLAIVSSSVAVGYGITNCQQGDTPDGRFVIGDPRVDPTPCPQIGGPFLIDVDDGAGGRIRNYTGTLDDAFACAAMLGNNGCGLEQPLEALRRALDGSHPESAGFVRDDALLLVVFLTDEDDGSARDPSVYSPTRIDDPFAIEARGFEQGVICDPDDASIGPRDHCAPREDSATIEPISTYADFLRALKPDPSMVMLAGIMAPPAPVAVVPFGQSSKATIGTACVPPPGLCAGDPTQTCARSGATPAIRLNALLAEFPARYTFASICDQTMSARVRQIAGATTAVMSNVPCLGGDATATADRCRALDLAPTGERRTIPLAIVDDPVTCGYTPTHQRAVVEPLPAGHRLLVECL